jgi:hypothetical protein
MGGLGRKGWGRQSYRVLRIWKSTMLLCGKLEECLGGLLASLLERRFGMRCINWSGRGLLGDLSSIVLVSVRCFGYFVSSNSVGFAFTLRTTADASVVCDKLLR